MNVNISCSLVFYGISVQSKECRHKKRCLKQQQFVIFIWHGKRIGCGTSTFSHYTIDCYTIDCRTESALQRSGNDVQRQGPLLLNTELEVRHV